MSESPFSGLEPGSELSVPAHPKLGTPSTTYTYVTAHGAPVFASCRFETSDGKTFSQGHPSGANGNGWSWNLRGVEPVLYRLDELAEHLSSGSPAPIYIVEGEKDADRLRDYLVEHELAGVVTTSPMGAGKWKDSYTEFLRGARHVVIIVDNDEPGMKHGRAIATSLTVDGAVDRVELRRPALDHAKADLSDHLDAELELEELLPLEGLIEETPAELAEGELLMSAEDFIALQIVPPPPLWGNEEHGLLVEGGLALFAGRPGTGKTTLIVDLALHLAAGLPYPPTDPKNSRAPEPWLVDRPLNIALIENEGPLELFRDKLRRKMEAFPHEVKGYLGVQVWRWGAFSFADTDAFAKAAIELEAKSIDLVIGDPLGLLGVEGVGSPDETGRFVMRLRQLGLGTRRAFLLIHHFRQKREKEDDELSALSGAWSQHLDSLITLSQGAAANELRLAFPKLRWSRAELPKPIVLGKVYARAGFEALAEEDDVTIFEPKLVAKLEETRAAGAGYHGYLVATQLANGIGQRKAVEAALNGAPHLFVLREGQAAKALGAKTNSKLWGLKSWGEEELEAAEPATAPTEPLELLVEHDHEPPDEYAGGARPDELDFH
jgi:hypothetical protein